ncbi:acetaldehyde dehydrogenase (acetylating) [Sporanaerobium hydrogeniformans]|uniref:Acetaldehyde dehydrogenase (Acetylating) n=1 Tax=Sporanaerobium hydrogeniformans TaxID=3072179 RepID=A0AC61DAK5_9FIRM|nr:acetaldehyde dehydrogenase (acetylating) [Sporanaerobium hydrogeniformans]PHV70289.1 acetaldehyde dehydrogenase (acetylating) [Sporanaerobium hydrogeniformans]
MELIDKDLQSLQEVRNLLSAAQKAQEILETFDQCKIDKIVKAIADAGFKNAEKLAKMANEETGFGKWEDKVIKNVFGSKGIYEGIKNQKTIGILKDNKEEKILDIGIPVGVIAGIVPSTNPTSTVMYKTLIAIKAGSCIVFSPHPSAKNCIKATVDILAQAAEAAGCPKGAISTITIPTLQATQELMKHPYTKLILATGGPGMVKSAYSSGTPAIGVGAGNGPAFIDKSADLKMAVKRIMDSKTFDNGTICASEQSIMVERCMEDKVVAEFKAQGGYFLDTEEAKQLGNFILRPSGSMNPQIVGKSVEHIAKLAGLTRVPSSARVLIAKETRIGHDVPYSREKLAPILAFYVEENVEAVLKKAQEILILEGRGHTFCIHANDEELVKRFALKIPASRILVNTLGALGGVGGTTNLFPALTLGCGAVGGSSSSNNIGPIDLINIKRVAYGVKELEDLRREAGTNQTGSCCSNGMGTENLVEELVKRIMKELI